MSVRLLQGESIFDGKRLLPHDFVLIVEENGAIADLRPIRKEDRNIEKLGGILSPGFINTHCHLELSHMKGIVPKNTGMVDFLLTIMQQRQAEKETILSAAQKAAGTMYDQGISLIGDICNTDMLQAIIDLLPLKFYHLVEAIGFDPALAESRFRFCEQMAITYSRFSPASVVPHAPYSVSQPLYQLVNQQDADKVISIHHAESVAEQDFFRKKESDFNRLHELIKTDLTKHTVVDNHSSIKTFLHHFTDKKILLVHNVTISEEDMRYIKEMEIKNNLQVYFAICIRANEYIGNGFPDLEMLFRYFPDRITIGTDSLASNDELNMMHELSLLKEQYPTITNEQWLSAITLQGAKALNQQAMFGSFEKGKKPGVVRVDIKNYVSERIF